MDYIAHKSDDKIQTIKEHSENTAYLSESFSIEELKELIFNISLLHDIGKYQPTFQRRINGENVKIPHAACGAKEASKIYKDRVISKIIEYCIAGHHSGLHDSGQEIDSEQQSTLCGNLKRETEDYFRYKTDINLTEISTKRLFDFIKKDCKTKKQTTEKLDFIIRYCFSCLTDADWLDTEEFCSGEKRIVLSSDFNTTLSTLNKVFDNFIAVTNVQKARSKLQDQAYKNAKTNANIFLLNMPTGSGKTLCSLKLALEKAIELKKKRIIYVIAYNSIIDQTCDIFEKNFKSLNVLRHQSSFSYEDSEDYLEDYRKWALNSTENWNVDFIVTTAVQFFESIYSNKKGKLRKLHNMADSIIIFDEAHLMPIDFLEPCLISVANITRYLNSEAIFLTATMPDFKEILIDKFNVNIEIKDLISDKSLFYEFNKCKYSYKIFDNEESLILDCSSPSKLIIVNNKKEAQALFNKVSGEKYHLSTYMTGIDRSKIITTIKTRLNRLEKEFPSSVDIPEERKITVVSTSLIEAGVDLDFHNVYRELSGLSSILQSGGRCNREGKRDLGEVVVFELSTQKLRSEQAITKNLFDTYKNISSPECIKEYYSRLFLDKSEQISKNSIYREGQNPLQINFKSYAENFKLIDDGQISVVIPEDEFCKDIMKLAEITKKVNSRKIQKYTVNINKHEFDNLLKQGVLNDFETGVFFLTNIDYYNSKIGIKFEGQDFFI